jgi:CRP-like cAMP-binding protein
MSSKTNLRPHLKPDCGTCETCPFCQASLNDQTIFELLPPLVSYPGKVTLFESGDYPTGVHLICSGRIKLWCLNEDSRRFTWRFAGVGEVLDVSTLFAQVPYSTIAETNEPCLIRFLPKALFFQFLKQHQIVERQLLRQISSTLHITLAQLQEFVFSQSALERLSLLLFRLSVEEQAQAGEGKPVRINLTRKEMAERIGVVPETISRLLGRLVKEGIIKRDQGFTYIPHPDRLKLIR